MNNSIQDIKIAGSGVVSGGHYRNVSVAGAAKIIGDVECTNFSISGSAKILGKVHCNHFKAAGSVKIESEVIAKEKVSVSGSAKVFANITAEQIVFAGSVESSGEINGESVEIRSSDSKVKSLVGEKIYIGDKKPRRFGHNHVDLIEATYIEMNSTDVAVVRGDEVIIGPYCKIDLVEYTTSLDIDKKATVKETRRV